MYEKEEARPQLLRQRLLLMRRAQAADLEAGIPLITACDPAVRGADAAAWEGRPTALQNHLNCGTFDGRLAILEAAWPPPHWTTP